MNFTAALRQLADWIAASNGAPILLPSGKSRSFRLRTSYTDADLTRYEAEHNTTLPVPYRQLLTSVGASQIFYGGTKVANGLEIHDLYDVRNRYADYFDGPSSNPLLQFLPVGCDNRLQEIAAYCIDQPAPQNFLVMSHETVPEDWRVTADELNSWCTLEDWIVEAVETEGDLNVH